LEFRAEKIFFRANLRIGAGTGRSKPDIGRVTQESEFPDGTSKRCTEKGNFCAAFSIAKRELAFSQRESAFPAELSLRQLKFP